MTRNKYWLSVAKLGEPNIFGNDARASESDLIATIETINRWVKEWSNADGKVGLCHSSTEALNAVLGAVSAGKRRFLTTSFAHPSIVNATKTAAQIFSEQYARQIQHSVLDLEGLNLSSANEVTDQIVKRIFEYSDLKDTVLILEHVTYLDGIRIPIARVSESLRKHCPDMVIVIDAAQASGLWAPGRLEFDAYIGCFHKFISGPPGSAFFTIRENYGHLIASHIRVLSEAENNQHMIHTLDLKKWSSVADLLTCFFDANAISNYTKVISTFNDTLDSSLAPFYTSLGRYHDRALRSHINRIRFRSSAIARDVYENCINEGYLVQLFDDSIRVAVGRNVCPEIARNCGAILSSDARASI